jgi:diketogulonate reductase-like aldo/keto reductase
LAASTNCIHFPDGTQVPALGQGYLADGRKPAQRAAKIAALRADIELGLTPIDTAAMYANGQAEQLVGEATRGLREQVFLVSKAHSHNASRKRLPRAC